MVYRGPTAPVTSVAIGGPGGSIVFAGCWNKDIWSWDRETGKPGRRYKGHTDFVKAIICARVGGKDVRCFTYSLYFGLIKACHRFLYLEVQIARSWYGISRPGYEYTTCGINGIP